MTKPQLQEMYVSYLRSEGYNPSVDSDGDVNFTAQGQRFYIDVMADDLQSFRIVLSDFLDIGPVSNRLNAFETAINQINKTKATRFFTASNNRIAIDSFIFIGNPDDFKLHLNRMVNVILVARRDFLANLGR
jgi:hypothetical protein